MNVSKTEILSEALWKNTKKVLVHLKIFMNS